MRMDELSKRREKHGEAHGGLPVLRSGLQAGPAGRKRPGGREKGAPLERVTWDEALDFTAQKLMDIKAKYGPDAIMLTGSSRGPGNEANYVMQKFTRACIGTNNIDNCART